MATAAQVQNFINQIAPIIQKVSRERGYSICSTVIAQAGIESAWNTSTLGYKYGNYFGLKCGSAWKGDSVNLKTKEEYTVGTLTTIKDNFRVYQTNGVADMVKGVNGYYDFISTKRYANLKTATDYKQYAQFLKADGYATSSTYVNTLCNTVQKYNLTAYDTGVLVEKPSGTSTKTTDELAQEVINGFWGSGTTRMLRLTEAGYDYKIVQARVNELLKNK